MPTPKQHRELLVQGQVNRGNATAGGHGATVLASAVISVLVSMGGRPLVNLGDTVGDGSAEVSLPQGWNFEDGFNLRPGGCVSSVTQFINNGNGVYDIRIVPFLGNPVCTWLSGEYVYLVQVKVSRKVAGQPVILEGGTLVKLSIP